jgi:hypothetical protein
MQRPDIHMIKKAMKAKGDFAPKEEEIKSSLSLPFFHFAYMQHLDLEWMQDKYLPAGDNKALDQAHISPNEWMFPEFVMTYKSRGVESRHVITVIHGLDECRSKEERYIMEKEGSDTLVYVWTWDSGTSSDENAVDMYIASLFCLYSDGTFSGGPAFANVAWPGKKSVDINFEEDDEQHYHLCKTLKESIGGMLTSIQMMHNWLKECDKHPVSVTPAARPKPSALDKKRPWRRSTGPSILFLDKMPSQKSEATGTGSSRRPHRRRGHWRTLSHPKYRHHPQYQQKIWVKPAFIGPIEEVHDGNMYRLIDQDHGMTIH